MTLAASGSMYLLGSSGLGATRSISKEVWNTYTGPKFMSDAFNDACSLPTAFSGDQVSDFYGHTQSHEPHDPTIVSLDWIGILDRVTFDWSHGSNACETPSRYLVYKRLEGLGSWIFVEYVNYSTSVSVFTEIFGGDPSESIQCQVISENQTWGTQGNAVTSSIETVQ